MEDMEAGRVGKVRESGIKVEENALCHISSLSPEMDMDLHL
jgi:hypothetical protein